MFKIKRKKKVDSKDYDFIIDDSELDEILDEKE